MQRFFRVTAPSVHSMDLTLERRRLIEREPGRARSIRLLLPAEGLPQLEEPRPEDSSREPQNNEMQLTRSALSRNRGPRS